MLSLIDELKFRWLLKQYTHDELFELYEKGWQTLYIWMDPTADSLHLWNFVGFLHAVQYMKRGNKLIFIVWGATWMIGDPWGKDNERTFLSKKTIAHNIQKIHHQVWTLLKNISIITWVDYDYEIINNADFYKDMWYLDFLRDVGKYMTVNSMMKKETVKKRIENPDKSISYTEFSYMLIQGYDFVKLHQNYGCKLQIAWSDQWGNVVTGIELWHKITNEQLYWVTTPLVLDSSGKKFGKSEGNALWLSPEKNSPYTIYQYFINSSDRDVETYLKLFSFLPTDSIKKIVIEHTQNPEERVGQKKIAYHITEIIFGTKEADWCVHSTQTLFNDHIIDIIKKNSVEQNKQLREATWSRISREKRILEILVDSEICESNSQAKKDIKQWLIFLNGNKINDIWYEYKKTDLVQDCYIYMQRGKKNKILVRIA